MIVCDLHSMVICLNRSSKYPVEEIIKDYESGYSFPKLQEKYGIPLGTAWEMIRKNLGKTRTGSESRLLRSKGWRRLPRVGKSSTRMVSIPFQHLKKLGFRKDSVLMAKWKVSDDHLKLFVKEIVKSATS